VSQSTSPVPAPQSQPELAGVEAYAARLADRDRRLDELLLAVDHASHRLRTLAADMNAPAQRLRRECLWCAYTLETAALAAGADDAAPADDDDDGVDLNGPPGRTGTA
jgi:hypothetical protein